MLILAKIETDFFTQEIQTLNLKKFVFGDIGKAAWVSFVHHF